MRKILLLAIMCCAGLVSGAGGKSELSSEVLRPERFPQLLTSREELAQLRAGWAEMPHLRQYVEEQRKIVVPLLEFSDDELRRLVPPAGAPIVYGLGMNLDPYGERLRWTSWKTPFKVMGRNNVVYPNADYPDDGSGCGKDGKKYYFTARAYGFVCSELEERVLPALGDLYALTGEKQYAHVAAVLLDAVAGIYPANRRGPLDYPGRKADRDRSGRLQRAYYMVARGLENYANTLDLITASGELEAPSAFPGFASIREHVAANLLRDGGEFCYDWAMEGGQLNNGLADYVRGAAYAGLLLRDERLLTPLLKGPSSLRSMLDNNVDRNGFYFEVSTTYSVHTTELYCAMAGIADAAVRQGLAAGASFYRDPGLVAMMDRFFIRRELSGPQSSLVPLLMHCTNDAERIADHTENILQLTDRLAKLGKPISDQARKDLQKIWALLDEEAKNVITALGSSDPHEIELALKSEQKINKLTDKYESAHIERLRKGSCNLAISVIFIEMLGELEKLGDHLSNIAERTPEIQKHYIKL